MLLDFYGGMACRGYGGGIFYWATFVGDLGDRRNVNEWVSVAGVSSCLEWGGVR